MKKNEEKDRRREIFKLAYRKRKTKQKKSTMEAMATWVSFYRYRLDAFIKDYFQLSIGLKPFQIILLFAMQHYNYFTYVAARGQGKSMLTALFATARAILYPGSEIVVASGTKGQAKEIVRKIEGFWASSKNLQREIDKKNIRSNGAEPQVIFRNGSRIRVVASNENARSGRSHILIIDEYRQVKKHIIDNVLVPFQTGTRTPPYLQKPEYENDMSLREPNKEIYLSSAYYKHHWAWTHFTDYYNRMVAGGSHFVCSLPYQLSVKENIYDRQKAIDNVLKSDFNPVDFGMEYEGLWFGESDGSFFKLEEFDKNRVLEEAYYPPEMRALVKDILKVPKKEKDEVRIVSMDIALKQGAQNDATAFFCTRVFPEERQIRRDIVYTESMDGSVTQRQVARVLELFNDFEADYLVLDAMAVGTSFVDLIGEGYEDRATGVKYEALKVFNKEDLAVRAIDPTAKPVIFAITATRELNDRIAKNFKNSLVSGKMKLLKESYEIEDFLSEIEGYDNLPPETQMKLKLPYIHTNLLVTETINLEADINSNVLVLKTRGSSRKDRYSSLSYSDFFITEYLEPRIKKELRTEKVSPSTFFRAKRAKLI